MLALLQVMLAADKEQGNMREDREDEKLLRIFIKVPKSHTEDMIQDYFKVFLFIFTFSKSSTFIYFSIS